MLPEKLNKILDLAIEFGKSNSKIKAIGLCGSRARGDAKPDSDIDLSIITTDKEYFKTSNWLSRINFQIIDEEIDFTKDVAYGRVWSRHIFLVSGIEIEFSFADLAWADTQMLDEGTIKVVSDGYQILYDPTRILKSLLQSVNILSRNKN